MHRINHRLVKHRHHLSHEVRQWGALEQNVQLSAAVSTLMSSQIPNTLNVVMTFQELFNGFQQHNCPLAFHGGAACSLINNSPPRDFDLDYSCTKSEVVLVLRALFPTATVSEPAEPKILVPHNIDTARSALEFNAFSYFSTIPPENQEYTANVLRLDITGHTISGYKMTDLEDCRAKVINLPVALDNQVAVDAWAFHPPTIANPCARVFKLFGKAFHWKTDNVKIAWRGAIDRLALQSEFRANFCEAVAFYLCLYISDFQLRSLSKWDRQTKKCNLNGVDLGGGPNFELLVQQPRDMRNAIIVEIPDYRATIQSFFINSPAPFP